MTHEDRAQTPIVGPSGLKPSTDDTGRFNNTDAATIRIYVTDVKVGGIETSNCHAKDKRYRDTHIEGNAIGPSYDGQPMIVEVTPRWRAAMKANGVDWSTATLHHTLIGHWIEVAGWLVEDTEHRTNSINATGTVKPQGGIKAEYLAADDVGNSPDHVDEDR